MTNILLLTSSPRKNSYSTRMAGELADQLLAAAPGAKLVRRDLGMEPMAHIDDVFCTAIRKPAEARSEAEALAAKRSDALVQELLATDTWVIGTGLINFQIDSALKTWIDHIARAGQTFRYTEKGPVGMVTGKKAYIVVASGGVYSQGPNAHMNHATPYLKAVLGFWGVTDVEVIHVEGLSMGPEAPERAMAAARARMNQLTAQPA